MHLILQHCHNSMKVVLTACAIKRIKSSVIVYNLNISRRMDRQTDGKTKAEGGKEKEGICIYANCLFV